MERARGGQHHNLPAQRTALIGRDHDVAAVRQLLFETQGRIVTLTGSGGCGKTRLALQVGFELAGRFDDGVWLVELASLEDPSLVPQVVATVFDVRERAGTPVLDTLLASLARRQLLLVLDNCEHLVEACAYLADAVLRACPGMCVLATSREPLRISDEVIWRVPALGLPDLQQPDQIDDIARSPAVWLFTRQAQTVQQGFELTPENARVVAQVCTRLDGLPLAVELAAAMLRVLGVEQLRDRLDDRFSLLVGGSRTSPSRQRTLEATLEWSYQLLNEPQRIVFARERECSTTPRSSRRIRVTVPASTHWPAKLSASLASWVSRWARYIR